MTFARKRTALASAAAALLILGALAAACSSDSKPLSSLARSTAGTQPSGAAGGTSQITTSIRVATAQAASGAETAIAVQALAVAAPGLGAWQMNVEYDPNIVTPAKCDTAATAACNLHFTDNEVRLVGASANGLQGDVTLMTLTFQCAAPGTSPLTVTPDLLADGTIGNPLKIEGTTTTAGSITCS